MEFELTDKAKSYVAGIKKFMREHIYPIENEVYEFYNEHNDTLHPAIEPLKRKARKEGLWNLFLGPEYGEYSPGLSNVECASVAEEMGKVPWASEIFNCNAPDSGNMEVLAKYGTSWQKEKFLMPLLDGSIRSAFLMTEPEVASSDATNIQTTITPEGKNYIISGTKWWATNAGHPNCKFYILMGKTNPDDERHRQHGMIIIPADTKGLVLKRRLPVFHYHDQPGAHFEIVLDKVKVPKEMLILGEGRGFEIAQGRLGPGRIHHCMRLIGQADRALDYMCRRASERTAFGQDLSSMSSVRQWIAASYCEIEQARLLTMKAADMIDRNGIKEAKNLVAAIKVTAPQMACRVIDRAIQLFGGKGLNNDTPLPLFYTLARALRIADGPDEVHAYQLGKNIIRQRSEVDHHLTKYFNE